MTGAYHLAVAALAASVAFAVLASSARAADRTVPVAPAAPAAAASSFDVAFGAVLTSNYIYRGFSISDRGPSVGAYVVPRYEWLYAGVAAASVDLPFRPDALLDFHAGLRPVLGPVVLDLRLTYYHFPNSVTPGTNIPAKYDFWQLHARPAWTVNEQLTLAIHGSHAPSFANTGAPETLLSASALVRAPGSWLPAGIAAAYLSGEVGHQWIGNTDTGANLPDYLFWNVGAGLVYKAFTFDLRYHDTNMSREECAVLTGDLGATPGGVPSALNPLGLRSNWCSAAIVGRISFDMSLSRMR
jgi:uncharacterized protein (TIGR02001 family)